MGFDPFALCPEKPKIKKEDYSNYYKAQDLSNVMKKHV